MKAHFDHFKMKAVNRKSDHLLNIVNKRLIDLPAPTNLSHSWRFGSILGIIFRIQVLTGILLVISYRANETLSFNSIMSLIIRTNNGWVIRNCHANFVSVFFILLYLHIGRGLYYKSFKIKKVWNAGILILVLSMATAFTGYVLVWGQIRFWGATVITNLFSAFPYIGPTLIQWLWGGFRVNNATLTRLFGLHFLMPFLIILFIILHFIFLHESGSSNPLGEESTKVYFHRKYSFKDLFIIIVVVSSTVFFIILSPYVFCDPENFITSNPMVAPIHIKPEWYFLWAYAILRSIPNKLGGVLIMFGAVAILFLLMPRSKKFNNTFYLLNQILYWSFISIILLLTWIGGSPVEYPYDKIGIILTLLYFCYFILDLLLLLIWDMS